MIFSKLIKKEKNFLLISIFLLIILIFISGCSNSGKVTGFASSQNCEYTAASGNLVLESKNSNIAKVTEVYYADLRMRSINGIMEESSHQAIDYIVKDKNLKVDSLSSGFVADVLKPDNSNGCGNMVKVDSGGGFIIGYCHLDSVNVKVGQCVKVGDIIGVMGNTGTTDAKHVHLQVTKNNVLQNPLLLINLATFPPQSQWAPLSPTKQDLLLANQGLSPQTSLQQLSSTDQGTLISGATLGGSAYEFVPKFKAYSNYNLSVYDLIMNDVDEILKCNGESFLDTCIGNKINSLNNKEANNGIFYKFNEFTPDKSDNYKRFYEFIDKLLSVYNYDISTGSNEILCGKSCKYDVVNSMTFKPDEEFDIHVTPKGSGSELSFGDYVVDLDFPLVLQSVNQGLDKLDTTFTFDLSNEPYIVKNTNSISIYYNNLNIGKDISALPSCSENRYLYKFYARYNSAYGIQYIPFALDFSTDVPPTVSDFNVAAVEHDENTFELTWDQIKDKEGQDVPSLKSYKIYCADHDFTNNIDCIKGGDQIISENESYDVVVSSCNGQPIVTGNTYYFTIVSLNSNGKLEKSGLVYRNEVAIDELAPGLSKSYRQEFSVSKSAITGDVLSEQPIINEDATPLSNFSNYMLFFTDAKDENALLTDIAGFSFAKCTSGRFDANHPLFCYPLEKDKKLTPLTDFTNVFSAFDQDPIDLIVYVIPVDASGNFVKEPNVWAQKYLTNQ